MPKIKMPNLQSLPAIRTLIMLFVVVGVGTGLYYRSVHLRSSALNPYSVSGYRVFGSSNTPFPSGVGLTTLSGLNTSDNPFSYGTSGGDRAISSSSNITYNGVTYNFSYGLVCYNNSVTSCPGGAQIYYSQPITITNPSSSADVWFSYAPAPPTEYIQANGSQGTITVAQNSALTVSWGSSYATSCTANGAWSGGKATQGSENHNGDTGSAGTRTYGLSCQGPGGTTSTSVTVTVQASAPPPTGSPPPSPPISTPTPTPTPNPTPTSNPATPTSTQQPIQGSSPSTPIIQGSGRPKPQPVNVATATPDTIPPTVPTNFTANVDDRSVSIVLGWQASTDNVGGINYMVERSTDQQNWQTLTDHFADTSYSDLDVHFTTHYYYRILAVDGAGNKSGYAMADALTKGFNGNAAADKELILRDDANHIEATLPAGALGEAASCSIESYTSKNLGPTIKDYITASGPFQILCKKADNTVLGAFNKPVTITWTIKPPRKVAAALEYYQNEAQWSKLTVTSHNGKTHTDSFTLDQGTAFVAMGKLKHTPAIFKILGILVLLLGIVAGVVIFLLRRYRQKQEAAYEDYMRKIRGG